MEIKVVNAGNCILCGKPLKLAVFPGSGEPCDSIFFCKECEQKVKNDRKRPESNARSATDELAEKMHITKEEALNKMKAAMGIKKVSCSHTDTESVKEWLPQYEGKWMAESEDE